MLVDPSRLPEFLTSIHLFGKLDDEQLAALISGVHPRLFETDQTIYEIGSDANDLYVIYRGKVRVQREMEGEPEYFSELVEGDYFGVEALAGENYHLTSVAAIEDTIVLLIDADFLMSLSRDSLSMRSHLNMIARSFRLRWNAPLSWREPDEAVHYIARRHILFMYLRMIGPALLALFSVFILLVGETILPAMLTPWLVAGLILFAAIVWGIWSYIDWTNDYYIITDRRVIYLERVVLLYDSRTEAPMSAILSVNKNTSQIGRLLGYGTITVRSFTGTIRMDQIAYPEEVQNIIEKLMMRAKTRQALNEQQAIDTTIARRLGGAPASPQADTAAGPARPSSVEAGGLQRFLVDVLHLRYEENGVITYRKHWFVLLRQVWWPLWILVSLFVLLAMRMLNLYTFISMGGTLALVLALGFVAGLWFLYQYVDWTNDLYIVTADQIVDVDKKPLGTESRKSAPIANILSIEYERQGFIGYVLNFGTVFIKVGASTLTFDYVFNPSEVQRDLFKRFNEFKYREKQAEDAVEQKRLADWIEGYDRWQKRQQAGTGTNPPPGPYPG